MRISLSLLSLAALGCTYNRSTKIGECPDGFIQDAEGNCVESDSDDPTDPDPSTDDTGDTDEPCEVALDDAEPGDGDEQVYWQDDLLFWLDGPDDTASVEVSDADGTPIEGTLTNEEGALTWSPASGLTPDTAHTATIRWCAGEETIGFTTSELGAPLETDVSGSAYALDLSTATWVKPAGLDMFIGDALDIKILMGIEEAGEVLDLVGAIPETDSEEQDVCLPTLDFDPIDFSTSPYFEVGPVDMPISLMGFSLTIWSMNISGTFQADGGTMSHVRLAGALDMREVGPALGDAAGGLPIDLTDPDDACDTLSLLGVVCEECPDGDDDYCLALDLTDIEAALTESVVVPIASEDIPEDCGADE